MLAVACFECVGDVELDDLSSDGVGILRRSVESNDADLELHSSSFTAFGRDYFDAETFFSGLDILFQMARQKFARLERNINMSANDFHYLKAETSSEFYELRLEICEFLCSLLTFVRRCSNDSHRKVVLSHTLDTILRVGQISELPSCITGNFAYCQGNTSTSSLYHLLHLHLDLKWYLLQILNELSGVLFDDNSCEIKHAWFWKPEFSLIEKDRSNPVGQYVNLILWDLVSLACRRFSKITMKEYLTASPFSCSCCKDLWILMIDFLDRKFNDGRDSFWLILHGIFHLILRETLESSSWENANTITTNSTFLNVIPDFANVNRLGFCWYLLLHLSPLYCIDANGELVRSSETFLHVKSNYFELTNLLKLTINPENYQGSSRSESQLRCYLYVCLRISEKWEMSTDFLLLLWEYFFKRLNDLFIDSGEISTTCASGKSSLDWVESIKYMLGGNNIVVAVNLNSYQLFLRLVGLQLKKNHSFSSAQEWRQLKGRIFSKFHPRRIQDLNLNGLHNCFCLFLTLASVADLGDVVGKVCDLLEMMNPSLAEHDKHCLIWRAVFALMLICEERNQDLAQPAQKMSQYFDDVVRDAYENKQSSIQSHMALELLNIYMEGIRDIFEHSSSLTLSEHILIASSFSELLANGSSSDLTLALTAVQVILARHRLLSRSSCDCGGGSCTFCVQHEAIADALFIYVLPIVKEKALGNSSLGILADVAAGLSLLMIETDVENVLVTRKSPNRKVPRRESFGSLVSHFYFGGHGCSAEFCSRFLSQCLCHPRFVASLEREFPDCHMNVLRVWVRLSLQLSTSNSHYEEVTKFILKLPETANLFGVAEQPIPVCTSMAYEAFFQALDSYHSKNVNLGMVIRQKTSAYTADVSQVVDSVMKRNVSMEVSRLYLAVGQLVRSVAALIYVRSKADSLLNTIVRTLLLPPSAYGQQSKIPVHQLFALKEAFPLFVEGLSRLGFRRDPYIARIIRDIFVNYLPCFHQSSVSPSNASLHPLVLCLARLQSSSPDLHRFVFEAVRDHYLRKGSSLQIKQAIKFVAEVLLRSTAQRRSECCPVLVPSLLQLLLPLDDAKQKQTILDVIKMMVNAGSAPQNENSRFSSLFPVLETFVCQNFAIQTERCLKLVEFLSDSIPDVVGGLVPLLGEQLNLLETRRGSGLDESLRVRFSNFLTNIESVFHRQVAEI